MPKPKSIFADQLLVWKERPSWLPLLTTWIEPYLVPGGVTEIQANGKLDICWNDPDWLEFLEEFAKQDVELMADNLSEDLLEARIRLYHACRVVDAGDYHRLGILRNDPLKLEATLRKMVATEDGFAQFRPQIDDLIERSREIRDRDTGRLFLGLDDQALKEDCGHYALYGSEWVMCVLGFAAHDALRNRGTPTIIEVNYPLAWMSKSSRRNLASDLLREFTHVLANQQPWIPPIDFSIVSRKDIPADFIAGHTHPRPDNGRASRASYENITDYYLPTLHWSELDSRRNPAILTVKRLPIGAYPK